MAGRSTLTDKDVKGIIQGYKNGWSLREVGKDYGISHIAVRYHLLKNGITLRKRGR